MLNNAKWITHSVDMGFECPILKKEFTINKEIKNATMVATARGCYYAELNGKRVDIASYLLRAGDIVTLCEKARGSEKFKAVIEANSAKPVPEWMDLDRDNFSVKVVNLPERDQIDAPVEEQLIVEFYSK